MSEAPLLPCPRCGCPAASSQLGMCPVCAGRAMMDDWGAPDEAEDSAAAPRQTLGEYDLLEEIGRGAMGAVYRGRHRRLGRDVALKVILAGQFASKTERRRFLVEAEAAAHLDHPNLVALFEQAEEEGRLFYAMQLIEGPTLAARLKEGPLPPRHAAALLAKCARAVHHAHERGVLHRDLKPGNVLLDGAGEPHVSDFGLARRVDQDAGLTLTGSLVGSPAYMAPEIAAGETATAAADIYSLGSMLYEMLHGSPPFSGATIAEVLVALRDQEPAPIRSRSVDRDLESVCLRALEKVPSRRYASALALAEDLERWLRSEPVEARHATSVERIGKWARRRPAIASLSALAMLLLVGGTAGMAWQWQRAVDSSRRARVARELAESRELQTRRALYAADMNLCQAALKANNLGRARRLLDAHRPASGELDLRSWEWRYLWAQTRSHALGHLPRAGGPVRGVALFPDGRSAITNDDGGHLLLWDAEKRSLRSALRPSGAQGPLALSPDGAVIVAPLNGEMNELRALDNSRTARLPGRTMADVAFSPDGALVAMQNFNGTTRVWKTDGSAQVAELRGVRVNAGQGGAVTFVPGTPLRLATATSLGITRFYRTDDWTMEREWKASSGECGSALAASPDGHWLVAGACFDDALLHVWDLASGERVSTLHGHTSWISALVFSPDGRWLYSASADQTVRVWNTADWRELAVLRGHSDEIWTLAISADGRRLISGSKNGEVMLWPAEPPKQAGDRFDFPREITLLSNGPGTSDLFATNQGASTDFSRWTPGTWRETPLTTERDVSLRSASGYFALRRGDGKAHFYTMATNPPTELGAVNAAPFDELIAAHDSPWMALMRKTGTFTVFDGNKREGSELPPLTSGVSAAKIDSRRRQLLALDKEMRLQRFDIRAERWMEPVQLPKGGGASWIGPAAQWVVQTNGTNLKIFRAEPQLHEVASLEVENPMQCVAFSPNGRWLAVANEAAVARLWQLDSTSAPGDPWLLRGHLNAIHGLTFTPDSTRLVTTCSNTEAAKFWDVETGREVLTLPGASTMLYFAGFFADGEVLAASRARSGGAWHAWHAPSLDKIAQQETAEK